MKNNENLMKHFASVLRGRALNNLKVPSIDKRVANYLTRKDLIEIIKSRFDGTIPKEHNLVEMENSELLELIGDEMYVISYMTDKWTRESREIIKKEVSTSTKTKPEKKNKKNDTIPK